MSSITHTFSTDSFASDVAFSLEPQDAISVLLMQMDYSLYHVESLVKTVFPQLFTTSRERIKATLNLLSSKDLPRTPGAPESIEGELEIIKNGVNKADSLDMSATIAQLGPEDEQLKEITIQMIQIASEVTQAAEKAINQLLAQHN